MLVNPRTPQENFANRLWEASTVQEITEVSRKVSELADAIFEIDNRFNDQSIMYYDIDSAIDTPKIEPRHFLSRLGTFISFWFDTPTKVNWQFASLVHRVLGVSDNKTPLEVNVSHLFLYISNNRKNKEVWFTTGDTQVGPTVLSTMTLIGKSLNIVSGWERHHPEVLSNAVHRCVAEMYTKFKTVAEDRKFISNAALPRDIQSLDGTKNAILDLVEGNPNAINDYVYTHTFKDSKTNEESRFELSWLHCAVLLTNNLEIRFHLVEFLLNLGADPTIREKSQLANSGRTVFDYFLEFGISDTRTLQLLELAQEEYNKYLQNPAEAAEALFEAIKKKKHFLIKRALHLGQIFNFIDENGNTPLHIAAATLDEQLIKLIANCPGIDKTKKNLAIKEDADEKEDFDIGEKTASDLYVEAIKKQYKQKKTDFDDTTEEFFRTKFTLLTEVS